MHTTQRNIVLGLGLAFLGLATTAAGPRDAQRSPVDVVRDASKAAEAIKGKVLYRQAGAAVVRDANARDEDFEDVYALNTHEMFAPPEFFDEYGETLAFEPGKF